MKIDLFQFVLAEENPKKDADRLCEGKLFDRCIHEDRTGDKIDLLRVADIDAFSSLCSNLDSFTQNGQPLGLDLKINE
ncbi:MAG: hypothetical protein ACE5MK_05845 [Acidobacteriota bacterium]